MYDDNDEVSAPFNMIPSSLLAVLATFHSDSCGAAIVAAIICCGASELRRLLVTPLICCAASKLRRLLVTPFVAAVISCGNY